MRNTLLLTVITILTVIALYLGVQNYRLKQIEADLRTELSQIQDKLDSSKQTDAKTNQEIRDEIYQLQLQNEDILDSPPKVIEKQTVIEKQPTKKGNKR